MKTPFNRTRIALATAVTLTALLTGCAIDGHAPYKELLTHGFTVDAQGRLARRVEVDESMIPAATPMTAPSSTTTSPCLPKMTPATAICLSFPAAPFSRVITTSLEWTGSSSHSTAKG